MRNRHTFALGLMLALVLLAPARVAWGQTHWSVNPSEFETSMSVVAAFADGSGGSDLELAAFVGDEVRGVTVATSPNGSPVYFLTIYGDGAAETVYFKSYDAATGEEVTLKESIQFATNALVGTVSQPYSLTSDAGPPAEWTVSPAAYQFSMNVVASLADAAEGDVLAAFAGSEIRGVAPASNTAGGYAFFLTIYANQSGEQIRFELFDASEQGIDRLKNLVVLNDGGMPIANPIFSQNELLGSVSAPVILQEVGQDLTVPTTWTVNPNRFERTMSIVASVSGVMEAEAGDVLAAFAGDEIRGIAGPTMVGTSPVFFLTVYSNGEGEDLTFQVFDQSQGTIALGRTESFRTNAVLGSPSSPIAMGVSSTSVDGGDAATWWVDPADYQLSMSIAAEVITGGFRSDDAADMVAAFVGSELRGVTSLTQAGSTKLAFLTVYANREGEQLQFRIYDQSAGHVRAALETAEFQSNGILGGVSSPFRISKNEPPTAVNDARTAFRGVTVQLQPLDNDVDLEDDVLDIISVSNASTGTTLLLDAETIAYTPGTSTTSDSFTYTISDGFGGQSTATVTVAIEDLPQDNDGTDDLGVDGDEDGVDDGVQSNVATLPTASNVGSVTVASEVGSRLAQVQSDPVPAGAPDEAEFPGGVLSFDLSGGTGNASRKVRIRLPAGVEINSYWKYGKTPDNQTDHWYNFSYDRVTKTGAIINGRWVTLHFVDGERGDGDLTVNGAIQDPGAPGLIQNEPPVATDDTVVLDEDGVVTIALLDNDSDADGDPLTLASFSRAGHGRLRRSENVVTYTPAANFSGQDSFTYVVGDGNGATADGTVSLTVNPVNDAPVAVQDEFETDQDAQVSISGLLANDTDADSDLLTLVSLGAPLRGSLATSGGLTTYTPPAGFIGTDFFDYTISDGSLQATGTVKVTIYRANQNPDAANDLATAVEDAPLSIDVLANDSDADSDPLTITNVGAPSHGTAMLETDNTITYTPEDNYFGTDSFDYTVFDGQRGTATATVTVSVTPVDDVPVAVDDTASLEEDGSVIISVLANDIELDQDDLTIVAVGSPGSGTATANPDGTITYTPQAEFGGTDSFTYRITDGNTESTATVSVTVEAINDAPVIAHPETLSLLEDGSLVFSGDSGSAVSVSDADVGTDPLSVSLMSSSPLSLSGTSGLTFSEGDGQDDLALVFSGPLTAVNAAMEGMTFRPEADDFGPGSLQISVSDQGFSGSGGAQTVTATVAIEVNPVNDAPSFVAGPDQSVIEDSGALAVTGWASTISAGPPNESGQTVSFVVLAANQGLFSVQPAVSADGTLTYTPTFNAHGSSTVTVRLVDDGGTTDGGVDSSQETTFSIAVTSVNDLPLAVSDAYSLREGATLTVAAPGLLSNDSDVDGDALTSEVVTNPVNGALTLASDGGFNYVHDGSDTTSDSFTYRVRDGQGGSATTTVSFTITGDNDPPVAAADSGTTPEDTALVLDVLGNDSDVDGTLVLSSVVVVSGPAHGTTTVNATTGSVTYTPAANFHGTDSFTYTVTDNGGAVSTPATVSVTVSAVNDAPVAVADAGSGDEDTVVTVAVLANDSDVDGDVLSISAVTQGTNGAVTISGASVVYTPAAGFGGTDSFTYTVSDGNGGTATATVTVTIASVNDAPVATDDVLTTAEDAAGSVNALSNDTDPDGDALTVTAVTQGTSGTVAFVATGTLTYTPSANFNGTDTFTYTVGDGNGATATATVSVTVAAVNDAPVASADSGSGDEDTVVTVAVLANDSDVDGTLDASSVLVTTATIHGTTSVHPTTGVITYTPQAGFNGTDSFAYTVQDNDGATSNAATVTISIASVNDAPVANDDAATTAEDTPVAVSALANDTDPDGDALTVTAVTQGTSGSVAFVAGGTLTYTPSANFNGSDSFTYTVSDGNGATATGIVSVTVSAVNDLPVALADAYSLREGATLTVAAPGLLSNDSDVDGDALTAEVVTNPVNGALTLASDGSFTYVHDGSDTTSDSFTYRVRDGHGGSATTTVSLTITGDNDPPVAAADSGTTPEDTALVLDVLGNDSDVDGTLVVSSVAVVSGPAHGTTTVNATTGSVTYTPAANYHGADSFTYTVTDNGGAVSTPATVSVTVSAVNDAPVAVADTGSGDEDTAVTVAVLANDSDVDGDALSISAVTQGTNGAVTISGSSVVYTPAAGFGGTDSFTYTVSDGNGGTATATVTVTIASVNDAPVATDDVLTTAEDAAGSVNALSNDTDADGDALTVTAVTQGTSGSVTFLATGTLTYTPSANFNGTDTFTYTASDGNGATATGTVSVTVTAVNDAPVASADSGSGDEDTVVTVAVLANDSDVDGTLDASSVLVTTATIHGTTSVHPTTGVITYTPQAGFNGTDSFAYTVQDNDGATSNAATVTISIASVNDAPVANDDAATTAEDTPVAVSALANDTDPDGDALTVTAVTQGASGSVAFVAGGTLTYTPSANFNGSDSFTYTVSDGNGGTATGTVSVTVTAVNDIPVALADAYSLREGATLTVAAPGLLSNDSDVDGDALTAEVVADPVNGALTLAADGSFTYVHDGSDTTSDSFTYRVRDGQGGSATTTVSLTITGDNDPPVAAADSGTTPEDTALVLDVLGNDSDVDGTLVVSSVVVNSPPSNGTATVNATTGSVTYTPAANYHGADSFTYTVTDNGGAVSTPAAVSVTVSAVNDAPIASADTGSGDEDTAVTVAVLANDSDVDGDALSISAVTQGTNGAVTISGSSVVYSPSAGFGGTDSFTYTVSDGNGGTATATVTVTIASVNDAPVATDDALTTAEDAAGSVNALSNDTDPDGDALTVTAVTQGTSGTVAFDATGTLTYTPSANFNGSDSFTYIVSDGNGATVTGTVSVTVTAVNDLPVALADAYSLREGATLTVAAPGLLSNDSDVDGDALTTEIVTNPVNGVLTLATDGSFTYVHDGSDTTSDTFTYRVRDGQGGSATTTVSLTITGDNDPPVAVADSGTTPEDTAIVLDVLGNDSDVDGTLVVSSVAVVSGPGHGTTTVNATTGSVTYTPAANYHGTDNFTYTVTDNGGAVSTPATVSLTVTAVNDPPVAVSDSGTTTEDTGLTLSVLANDSDVDGDALSISAITQGTNAAVTISGTSVVYTPAAGFGGTDSFTYTVSDGNGGTATATVSVTITSVNDAPVATDDVLTTTEDAAGSFNALTNDSDPDGDGLTVSAVTQGTSGSVTFLATGTLTYTPLANFNGTDTFTYTVSDGNGATATATVSVTVAAVNDLPVALADAHSLREGATLTVAAPGLLSNDSDVDGDALTAEIVTNPVNGALTLASDGSFTYVHDGSDTTSDTFTYRVRDGQGGSATTTVSLTITGDNDPPVAAADSGTTPEDTALVLDVLGNDSDVDGTLVVSSVVVNSPPSNGTATVNATTGSVTYTPAANYHGADSFTYTVTDNGGAVSTPAAVSVTVSAVNDAPIASADTGSGDEDTAVTVAVLANDSDVDGDALSISAVTQGTNGAVTISGSSVVYSPSAGFGGTDSFTYTVSDGNGGTATATVTVTIASVNDAPVATDDALTTAEDAAGSVNALSNDTDPDGDALTVTAVTQGTSGTVAFDATGTLTYTPSANFNGSDSFTYIVSDGNGATVTGTVSVTVTAVNDLPVALADAYSLREGATLTVAAPGLLSNDSDVDGDALTAEVVTDPGNGVLTLATDGSFTYVHDGSDTTSDSFTYRVRDGQGGSATTTVSLTITGDNDPPVAAADSGTTPEDTALVLDVLGNDSDVDGTLVVSSVAVVSGPSHGATTVNATTGSVTYTPAANFHGTDSFTYTVTDNGGAVSSPATVSVTVAAVNDAPVAVADSGSGDEDTVVTVAVLANDSDVDGDALSISAITQGTNGAVTISGTSVVYTPAAGFGGTDSFIYTVSDGNGGTATATVTVTIASVNDVPVATDDVLTTAEDAAGSVNALSNDTDPDGDALTVTAVTQGTSGTVAFVAGGTLTYTPLANFNGTDTFTYTVSDGNGATATGTVSVTVAAVNDAPVAVADAGSGDEDTVVTVAVLTNDSDVDGDALSISAVTQGTNGAVTISGSSVVYTPAAGFEGTDSFTYTVSDGNGGTATATVSVTITSVNDAPVATTDVLTTAEDNVGSVNVLTNDTDPDGDALSVTAVTQGTNGTVTIGSGGVLTYTPSANFHGTDSFTYTVNDGNGGTATGTVSVTVIAVNDLPVALADAYSLREGATLTVAAPGLLSNDSDVDGDALTAEVVTNPGNGALTLAADGSFTYVHDGSDTTSDTFTYRIRDGQGGSATTTVSLTITGDNDPPVAVADSGTTPEDTALVLDVLGNDSDVDGTLVLSSVAVVSGPGHGSTTFNATTGVITYTPAANFHGADSFTYTVTDNGGAVSSPATVSLTVTAVNDAPVAVADSGAGDEDTTLTIDALANDSDVDGDALSISAVTQGTNGAVSISGASVVYTPAAGFGGTDAFTYTVHDGNGGTASATVSVTITSVNDAPVATNDALTTAEDVAGSVNVLTNDTDPDGDALTVTAVTQGTSGSVALVAGGTLTYTPSANFNGSDSFTYIVSDGNGATATATVSVTVAAVNDLPVALADAHSLREGATLTVAAPGLLSNDSDVDGDALTTEIVTNPLNGVLTLATDGSFTYVHDGSDTTSDSFTYRVRDGQGGSATTTVGLTITADNDPPVAAADSGTTPEDTAIVLDVLGNDSDVDGTLVPGSVAVVSPPSHGATTVNATTGAITYTPAANFHGTDSFTYTVTDNGGAVSSPATVNVTISSVNDAPVSTDDVLTTTEDVAGSVNVLTNDTDPDGDALTVTAVTQGANGIVAIGTGGAVTYTPSANFHGTDSFTYTVSDGNGGTATGTVSVTVSSVNDAPVAVNDTASGDEDNPLTIAVLANDSDPDDDALSVASVTQGTNGTVLIGTGGLLTYTPSANFHGTDSFTYTLSDGNGETAIGTVNVSITSVNDPPNAAPDVASTNRNLPVTIPILDNDTDPDNTSLTVLRVEQPSNGIATNNGDGTVTYTPSTGFSGQDTFDYVLSDGEVTVIGRVFITINPNAPPVASDDAVEIEEDTEIVVAPLGNDADPDGETVTLTNLGDAGNGAVVDLGSGAVRYTPNPDFHGQDNFTYTISDPGGLTDQATVTITVLPVNDPPEARNDTRSAFEGRRAEYLPLENDVDADGDELAVTAAGPASHGTVSRVDGETIAYTPPAGFSGTDTFTYTISDGRGGTSTARVDVSVDALPADNDGVESSIEDGAPNQGDGNGDGVPDNQQANVASIPSASTGSYITLSTETGSELEAVESTSTNPASEPPPEGAQFPAGFLSYRMKGGSGNAKRTVTILLESGSFDSYFKYGPTPDNPTPHWYNFAYDGETGAIIDGSQITLHFVDGKRGDDDLAPNGIIVDPGAPALTPNKIPSASPDMASTLEDEPVTINVLENDSDQDGDALSVVRTTRPRHGRLTRSGSLITYSPETNFFGNDGFSYVVSDGKGSTVSGSVSITVASVNDLPVAVDDHFEVDEDQVAAISGLLDNDTDVETASLTLVKVQGASRGLITVSYTGQITYTPPLDFSGNDVFFYTISDGTDQATGTAHLVVRPVNDAPMAVEDHASLALGQASIGIDVLANDSDVDSGALTLVEVSLPSHGTAVMESDGSVTYRPGPTFTNMDSFAYTVADGDGASSVGTVFVTLGEVAPMATADVAVTDEDVPVIIPVTANDVDPNGDDISLQDVGQGAHGTTQVDGQGNVVYTPQADFFGTDSFTYTISDGELTSTGTVSITISAVNDAPRFQTDSPVFVTPLNGADVHVGSLDALAPAPQHGTLSVEFNAASDPEGTTLTYRWELATEESLSRVIFDSTLSRTHLDLYLRDIAPLMEETPGSTLTVYHRVTASDGELETASPIESANLIRGYITSAEALDLPSDFVLDQNYPNPFNPLTTIRFGLPRSSRVSLSVFDLLGRHVAVLVSGDAVSPGWHEVSFDASSLPSGTYFCRLAAGSEVRVMRMVVVK